MDRPAEDRPVAISRATNADILQTVVQMRLDMTGTFTRLIEQVSTLAERMAKLEEKLDMQIKAGAELEAQHRVTREALSRLEAAAADLEQRMRAVERFKWEAGAYGAMAGAAGGLLWELVASRLF